MKKIKIGLGILTVAVLMVVATMTVKAFTIPAADQANNAPVIENGELTPRPFYVISESPVLKTLLGVKHEFPGAFSTELTAGQVKALEASGIRTEPVQIRKLTGKPTCNNNGTCEPELGENPSCADCKNGGEEPPPPEERTCFPADQYPWGITKVNGGTGGGGTVVAVLDTGVNQEHLDLAGNIQECITKATHFRPDRKTCEDAHGHGTHVAGTVLGNGGEDGLGIYGVAPEAKLMAVKTCDRRGYCYGDDVAAGILYAADKGVEVISMSFGGDDPDYGELAAIDYATTKGVLVVAAAGNDGPSIGSIDYPAAYYKVIAAGAIDSSEQVPSWSSRGINDSDSDIEEQEIEFGAPGVSVESTYKDGCYAYKSGTSMATPHVSGLAAKLWQGSASSTRTYLQGIAKDILPSGMDTATGFGLPIAP